MRCRARRTRVSPAVHPIARRSADRAVSAAILEAAARVGRIRIWRIAGAAGAVLSRCAGAPAGTAVVEVVTEVLAGASALRVRRVAAYVAEPCGARRVPVRCPRALIAARAAVVDVRGHALLPALEVGGVALEVAAPGAADAVAIGRGRSATRSAGEAVIGVVGEVLAESGATLPS